MTTDESPDLQCPICSLLKAFDRHPIGKHLRAAQRETLLAVRGLLDARIQALSDEAEAGGAKRVDVE